MKYNDEPFAVTSDILNGLRRKRSVFRQESQAKNAVHLVMVRALKMKEGPLPEGIAAAVSLDDLFAF